MKDKIGKICTRKKYSEKKREVLVDYSGRMDYNGIRERIEGTGKQTEGTGKRIEWTGKQTERNNERTEEAANGSRKQTLYRER